MKVGPRQGPGGQERFSFRSWLLLGASEFSKADPLKERLNQLGSIWIDLWGRMKGSKWKYI